MKKNHIFHKLFIVKHYFNKKLTFKYEFYPISMKYTNHHGSISTFIITICAIFGGAFSLTKFFHSLFRLERGAKSSLSGKLIGFPLTIC